MNAEEPRKKYEKAKLEAEEAFEGAKRVISEAEEAKSENVKPKKIIRSQTAKQGGS